MESHWCVGRAPLWLGGLAAFGIVTAHCLAYVLAAPNHNEMSLLMDATGHRYWGVVVGVALGAAIGGAAGLYVREFRAPSNDGRRLNLFMFAGPRLAAFQVAGFVLLEAVERALFAGGLAHPLEQPAVIAGLALQIVVALTSALILTLVARLVRFIAKLLGDRTRAPRALSLFGTRLSFSPHDLLLAGGACARGPPGV